MSQALEQRVREVVAPALPRADLAYTVEADAPLRNIGFDSLGLMGLIANLELEFNIQVEEDDLDFRRVLPHVMSAGNFFRAVKAARFAGGDPQAQSGPFFGLWIGMENNQGSFWRARRDTASPRTAAGRARGTRQFLGWEGILSRLRGARQGTAQAGPQPLQGSASLVLFSMPWTKRHEAGRTASPFKIGGNRPFRVPRAFMSR